LLYPKKDGHYIPWSDVNYEFGITKEQLRKAVLEGKVRTLEEYNPHRDSNFTIYALADLEKLFPRKRQARIFTKKEGTIWEN
jgi:hypothetical protein